MPFLFSIKTVASKIRAKGRKHKPNEPNSQKPDSQQDQPSLVPQLPPLNAVHLPRVLPEHQSALADQGWTKITYDDPHERDELYSSSKALFRASKAFFDLPASQKQAFKTKAGSEEGWSHVEGEKEFITLRTLENTPLELKGAAAEFWRIVGSLMDELIGRISESVGLPPEALDAYSKPCNTLGLEKTATMLRLFRYEGFEKDKPKVVAEPHRDLGMLSLVIGDTPGLEVWDGHAKMYFPIERTFTTPAASVLVGRQIERLTNFRYRSGGHLVRSYPDTGRQEEMDGIIRRYRYSAVFVLRAHYPLIINTDELTTAITGPFWTPLVGITGEEFFRGIQRSHFNINTGLDERNKQRIDLAKKKAQEASQPEVDQKV
ncbi:hypothetical protein LSUE1_G001179 [Lachnellula suecica]|uniref:Isopenicillin N synthase-like Fe(2+) 2OG dioxygenase domain-containing protein n=1 Tax=Lachnellula suecica TaxID=602035 RepID=A0A8T9C7I1_9HELO|nr:hypothetical protein LSUE1_G001179 [Lachnellula suecica]